MGTNEKKKMRGDIFQSMSNGTSSRKEIRQLKKEIENEQATARRKSRIGVYYIKSLALAVGAKLTLPPDIAEAVRMKLYRISTRMGAVYKVQNENGHYKVIRFQ